MPGKRKRSVSRGRSVRRRIGRRKFGLGRFRRVRGSKFGFRMPPHAFHRWVTGLNLISTGASSYASNTSVYTVGASLQSAPCSMAFQMDDVPNVSEFQNLFDYYKLNRVLVTIKMIPNPDAQNFGQVVATNNATWYPTLWYVVDHDDNNTVTLAQIKEFERVKHRVLKPNSEIKIMVRPTNLIQCYRTLATTGYQIDFKKQYLDMANLDIPHYGLKMVFDFEGIQLNSVANNYQFKINAKYYFTCKSVR